MFRAVFLITLALAFSSVAEEHVLIKPIDTWRVQAFTNSLVSSNWTQIGYDDSAWPLLPAGFATSYDASYPGASEVTILPENVLTYCFRKKFQIDDPLFAQWLALRVDYESGFVAYLNGAEIARRGFSASTGPIPLGTPANAHPRGPTEILNVSEAAALLVPGDNVLAIQLHSAGPELPSMLLVADLTANFTRGPFLQSMTTNSVTVVWQTATPTTGSIAYGKDIDHLLFKIFETASTNHVLTLTNLEPGQTYQYRVFAEANSKIAASDWYNFHTFSLPGAPVTFLVFGDSGQASIPQYKIADQLEATSTDLILHTGDIIYYCFNPLDADARFFGIYGDKLRSTPFYSTQGNHEGYCSFGAADFYNAFYFPTNSATGTEEWYSFDHGDAHFVVLNADLQSGHTYFPGSVQYNWLEADLAATKQRWKFFFFHEPIRSSAFHGLRDNLNFNQFLDSVDMQNSIGLLASRYGAQVIFNGHDHDYERFASLDGYNSFVTGGGGASLYYQEFVDIGSAQYYMRNHFLRVTVNGPNLKVEAVGQDGIVFDRFYRSQNPSGPGPFPSTWGAPMVEATTGSDLAGNIADQTFNFSGASLPTRAGQRANLGRFHVRNDRDFVYLGFESASIWTNQVIALFLENPNQPGIDYLAPLGNGQPDGEINGEGADGLDLLTNLNFRNFHPSIACLLGDEKADATIRNFKRAGMSWATGQGVFRLDQTFSTLPGARLQQFDRSPQTAVPQFFNANADLIEVAIPLAQLGDLGAARQIKVGAIAFTDFPDPEDEASIILQIDTAVLGAVLDAGANGTFTLEPTTIQLASDPDPTADGFAFTATLVQDNTIRFEWNSVPGVPYMIQSCPALGQPFQDVTNAGLPIIPATARATFNLPVNTGEPARYYRLRAN
jgi:hypothetical protein